MARAIGVKDDECAFRIGGFYEIAEEHDFWTLFSLVETKVALARAIGVKDDECAFRIGGFYEIAEE
ncbi:hypothetical protein, partial [Enterococcus sp. UD-01]|uniref:hypothetical protein n=1 Tax=Enterococcus sp. UD-01 TaxID=3373911 RepID=UPI003838C686